MRRYKVRVVPSAMRQIGEAVRYLQDELSLPQAARRLLDDLEEAITGLTTMPERFRKIDDGAYSSTGTRRMNVRKYSVFYRVDEDAGTVDVLAVLYGSPSDERLRRVLSDATQNGLIRS